MLPPVRTNEEWQAVVWNEEIVRPAAEDLAARLGPAGVENGIWLDLTKEQVEDLPAAG